MLVCAGPGDAQVAAGRKGIGVNSLVEALQVAMDNETRRDLTPVGNRRNLLEVFGDFVERVDPVCLSDPMTAAMKALGTN
jgi:ATP-dependent Lon protease